MNRRGILLCLTSVAATAGLMCVPGANAQKKADLRDMERPMHRGDWRRKLKDELPMLGHRNWILIVDAAYPLQTASGVETIETGTSMSIVRQKVLQELSHEKHVRPTIYMDSELRYLKAEDVPGILQYRQQVEAALSGQAISELPHEQIIAKIDDAGKLFHVLVLKTTLTLPYTSMFLQLDCKYWSDDSEAKLRNAMRSVGAKEQSVR